MFRKFRAEIQGIPADTPDSDLGWDQDELKAGSPSGSSTNISPQECVSKGENPVNPFTGYVRTDGKPRKSIYGVRTHRRSEGEERKQGRAGAVPGYSHIQYGKAAVTYADAVKGGRE
jgi:hypothetical protein